MNQESNPDDHAAINADLENARNAWLESLSAHKSSPQTVDLPHPARMLSDEFFEDCKLLADRSSILKQMPVHATVAEIGAKSGDFSSIILDICQPEELHLLGEDLHVNLLSNKFKSQISDGSVSLHHGNSSKNMRDIFSASYFDFIYIDGDHNYPAVKKDIQIASLKLKPNGYLIFNDYTYWSPVDCTTYGVMQAVNEFCWGNSWQARYFALAHYMYCNIAIQKPDIEQQNKISFGQRLKAIFRG